MSMNPYGAFPAQQPAGFPVQPQQFGQQPAGFPVQPQQFGQQPAGFPAQPQQQPGPAPAAGSLDAFNGQPVTGRPNAISWKDAPLGTTVQGVVAADVTDQDVSQDTDPNTKQLKFFRDGRPQFNMAVTLRVQPDQTHPEGLATLYVRGRMKDALAQGMAAAGATGAPKAGDLLAVTLTERRAGRGAIPANIYAVNYQRPGVEGVPMPQAPAPAQPVPMPEAPAQAPGGLSMTPEQAQLLARLTGQNPT